MDFKIGKHSRTVRNILKYLAAIILPFGILFPIIAVMPGYLRPETALLLMAGVVISSWYLGFKQGILTAVISGIISTYFFIPPYSYLSFLAPYGIIKMTVFISEGILICYVITERTKKTKIQEFKDLQKNLKRRIMEPEIQADSAAKEIKYRDEFLSIASHELKTPLTSMLLQTQHAIHNIKNVSLANFSIENLLGMLVNVENQIKRLSRMINDLLNISQITTGNMRLELEDVDLNTLATNVIKEFSPRIEREGYNVKLLQKDRIIARCDKIRIEQALSNLISNALKYGGNKPITVTVKKHREFAHITVSDQGIGIPKAKQKNIFGLFERGVFESNRSEQKGLGVGLYITKQIAEMHSGSIHLTSAPHEGSAFTIQIPIHISPNEEKKILAKNNSQITRAV